MPIAFDIQHIAIHLVDKQAEKQEKKTDKQGKQEGKPSKGLRYSPSEVNLNSYSEDKRAAILKFLSEHIEKAWNYVESQRTRPANFQPNSSVRTSYEQLTKNGADFFEVSKSLAKSLYDLSPTSASRGLLLVLWFTVPDAPHPFLGLFKLDPGRRDQIALDHDNSGQILLRLAVQSIQEALPEPGDRVLKWALIPHPPAEGVLSPFELKLRDEQQSGVEIAVYFEKFLGCAARLSVKHEVNKVFGVIEQYAKEHHPKQQEWQRKIEAFVQDLSEGEEAVTTEVLTDKVEKAALFPDFNRPAFQAKLAASDAREMRVAPAHFRQAYIHYYLEPSKIKISGPLEAMEDEQQVEVKETAGGYEIRIFSPKLWKEVKL